jgi:hypothetical protein
MENTGDRIASAVLASEAQLHVIPPTGVPPYEPPPPLRWLVLTGNLSAATSGTDGGYTITVPATASAHPAEWQGSANSGAGGYIIDTATTYRVIEGTGKRSFNSGDWLLCRPLGAGTLSGDMYWEPLKIGYGLCFGKTTGNVASTDVSFTVNTITAADSSGPPTTDSADSMTISNWAGWSASTSPVKIMFCVASITAAPGSGSNIGSGSFIQGPCPS